MNGGLNINNRQRLRRIDTRWLRRLSSDLVQQTVRAEKLDLSIEIVRSKEITWLNETFLRHAGSTDVITFNYSEDPGSRPTSRAKAARTGQCMPELHGEIFVCMDEALAQSRRFRTSWQSELVRYVIHGVLHLSGHDDLRPAARRIMKREENRLLKLLRRRFPLSKASRGPKVPA